MVKQKSNVKNESEWVSAIVQDAGQSAMYGKITLHFEAGKVILIRKEETVKPPKSESNTKASGVELTQ